MPWRSATSANAASSESGTASVTAETSDACWRRMAGRRSGARRSRGPRGGGESAGHLRRLRTREPDLVERKVHVGVPVHHRHDETDVARLVAVRPSGRTAHRELTQAVVQAVDGLHRGRRVREGRLGERAFSHVDEHPHAVRDVLFERSLEAEHGSHRRHDRRRRRSTSPVTRNSGAPAGTNAPSGGTISRTQSASLRERHELVAADRRHDSGVGSRDDVLCRVVARTAIAPDTPRRAVDGCQTRRARSMPRRAVIGRCGARTARARRR